MEFSINGLQYIPFTNNTVLSAGLNGAVTYQSHNFAGFFQCTNRYLVRHVDSGYSIDGHDNVVHSVKPQHETHSEVFHWPSSFRFENFSSAVYMLMTARLCD